RLDDPPRRLARRQRHRRPGRPCRRIVIGGRPPPRPAPRPVPDRGPRPPLLDPGPPQEGTEAPAQAPLNLPPPQNHPRQAPHNPLSGAAGDRRRALHQRGTVKTHLTHLYAERGVSDRATAVSTAHERRRLPLTPDRTAAPAVAQHRAADRAAPVAGWSSDSATTATVFTPVVIRCHSLIRSHTENRTVPDRVLKGAS